MNRKPRTPDRCRCRHWRIVADDGVCYIEQCEGCGRQRARIFHQ